MTKKALEEAARRKRLANETRFQKAKRIVKEKSIQAYQLLCQVFMWIKEKWLDFKHWYKDWKPYAKRKVRLFVRDHPLGVPILVIGTVTVGLLGTALVVYTIIALTTPDDVAALPPKDHALIVSQDKCWIIYEDDYSIYDKGIIIRIKEANIYVRDPLAQAVEIRDKEWGRAKEIIQRPDLDIDTCFRDEAYRN